MMKAKMQMILVLLGVSSLAALTGCTGYGSDLDQWIEETKNKPARQLDPIPPAPEFDRFTYQAHHLRDPFRAFVADPSSVSQGPRPDPDRPREPLEDYPLDSLRMVGTIGEGASRQGLVMDPSGITHRVLVGRYLGSHDGRVVGVSADRIEIVELTPNGQGGWEEAPTGLSLSH